VTCSQVIDRIEAIASGDAVVDEAVRRHLETCPRCASALAAARRLEAMLAARPAPAAPDRFGASVLQAVRRERWRAEQQVDRLFNIAMAAGLAVVVFGVIALLNLQGLLAFAGSTWSVATSVGAEVMRQAAPTLATYVAAVGLLLSTLLVWWWADRRLSL
jgi:anti-sigma factor RsiW